MKSFMENFDVERENNRKKSKYETIINRLRWKNSQLNPNFSNIPEEEDTPTPELNIPIVLKAMTPSYNLYRQQLDNLLNESGSRVERHEIRHSVIIPKVINKLGLMSSK